jgi:hypothetical protein
VNWDVVTVNALNVSATAGSKFTIKVISLNSGGNAAGSLSGLDADSEYVWRITTRAPTVFDPNVFTIDASAFSSDLAGTWTLVSGGASRGLELHLITAAPEPSAGLLWGLAGLLGRRHRRPRV